VDELGTWLTINEAAKLTGWLPDKIRSDRRRGRVQGRKNNAGEWLVLIPPEAVAMPSGSLNQANGHAVSQADSYATSQAMAEPPAWLLEELAELRERCGRAESLAESRAEHIASLLGSMAAERAGMAEVLAKTEARADRLAAELAEARKPMLVRLVEAIRRR
jgi:hypothetical protein